MKAKQFFFAGTHPAGVEPPREAVKVDDELPAVRRDATADRSGGA